MRAERLLADLLDEGVQLWAEGEDLCYRTSDDAVIRSRRQELLEHKAEIVALLGPGRRYAVPSFAQQRMWFLAQQEPLSTADNLPVVSRLRGRLEVAALESTFREIVRRHEILRTLFGTFDERPVQVIGPGAREPMLPLVDLGGLVAAAGEAEARHLAVSEAARPFDLAAGPLLRTVLLRLGDDQHLLLMNLHHIHWDGWSQGILDHELATLYQAFSRGEPSPLPELGVQFSDFAVWQREWLSGAAMETQLAYWRAELGGDPPLLRLPTDRPRPAVAAYRGGEVDFELSESLTRALGKLSREAGASLYMTLLAAFMILLARHAGQNVVVVGSPITHRRRRELEGLIGFFVNTVALRGDLTGGPSFRDFLEQIRKRVLDAFAHQDVPFEKLVEELQPARDPGRHPLFQVMFALQDAAVAEWKLPGLTVTQEEPGHQAVRFYLEMHCLERPQGLQGIVNYPVELFDAVTIERMVSRFQSLLAGIAAEPHHRIPELPLLCAADEEELRSQAEADPPAAWWTADGDGGRVAIVPIEPAAAGRRLHLLDERGRPVPAGIVGEVRIAGLEPERIGDLGCRHRDGTLEITGSTDGAIWRRGVRMSPAVTWEALLALPEVADGTILRRHAENGEVELVA
ncbi:MAG: hypothetical protein GY856_02720, partial [bacterium]|nr:hypothetical protein [bacterium]